MGKLFLEDKVCFLITCALMVSYSAAEREFFYKPKRLTWDAARSYCQVCFKDLVTLTPENIQTITQKVTSESWVGLRKSFYSNSSLTSNTTVYGNSKSTRDFTTDSTRDFTTDSTRDFITDSTSNSTSNSTHNSTTSIGMPWSHWANGDPLSFQNWYPGWPVLKSSLPKRYCCSCSCTCPRPTTPSTTTQSLTDISSYTNIMTNQQTDFRNIMENSTETSTNTGRFTEPVTDQSSPVFTAIPLVMTSLPPIQAECVRSPMQTPDVPYVDENYIEDSCVAMLSFGAWIEKECSELLPFICYEDRFFGQASVTNVTLNSAVLTWQPGPGDIDRYRVEVIRNQSVTSEISTNLTFDLENLTAGSHYSVKVFAVKCDRDLNPQEVDFYTTPNKVLNLRATTETETSISLNWTHPAGNVDVYVTKLEDRQIESAAEGAVVETLAPGNLYTFIVVSGVNNKSQWSEESRISAYTKPGKVSNLKASENTNISLWLTWEKPVGGSTGYNVTAEDRDSNEKLFNEVVEKSGVKVTGLPTGSRITLSVRAVINYTLQGDEETIHSYTAPAPIAKLALVPKHNEITATWDRSKGNHSSFAVRLQLDGKDVFNNSNLTEPREVFKGLKSGAYYTVIVYAVSGHLRSPPVNESTFTLPMPPTNLTVSDFDKNTITLKWEAPVEAAASNYFVKISSSFWGHSFDVQVSGTSYKFQRLRSGTNYMLSVQTVAGQERSSAVSLTHFTEADAREISLSMLCSSQVSLLCDGNSAREGVLRKLKEKIEEKMGDKVFWKLEG